MCCLHARALGRGLGLCQNGGHSPPSSRQSSHSGMSGASTQSELVTKQSLGQVSVFWFRLPPATKAPHGRPSPRRRVEENEMKEAETGGSG